jgi:hypothetical protein
VIQMRALPLVLLAALLATAGEPVRAQALDQPEPSFVFAQIDQPARMIGYPAVCPGSSPEEDQSEVICLAELYEADVRVLRHLDGPETGDTLRVRFTAHSFSAVWREDVRFLLGLVPFEDQGNTGHFAWFWDWESDGELCEGEDNLADQPAAVRSFYESGPTRTTTENDEDWSEGLLLRCADLGSPE